MDTKTVVREYIIMQDDEARIAGKDHLKAELVARMHVNGERTIEEVMAHYGLTRAEVHAVLAYYYENQTVLDASDAQSWQESKAIKAADLDARIRARMSGHQE